MRSTDPIEDALKAILSDFDAGRYKAIADRLPNDIEYCDEITGGWLRGRAAVTRYLDRLSEVCDEISSPLRNARARWLSDVVGLISFEVHQEYILEGTPRREILVGSAVFSYDEGEPRLETFTMGATRLAVA